MSADRDLPDFDRAIPAGDLERLGAIPVARAVPPRGEKAMWFLRGDRTPEKVEARGKRRTIEVPADATHWCHEGDAEWTPLEPRKTRTPDPKGTRKS